MMLRTLILLALGAAPAAAIGCPANPDALGTARTLTVDSAATPRVGRKHFPETLPLQRKEVVLTFDDGPWPGTTDRVLAALRRECVKATFFLLGRNAAAHPALARRTLADGHTVGHHTYAHPLLNRMDPERAEAEIDRGIEAVELALYGESARPRGRAPRVPFFRFPGFASSPVLLGRLERRGIVVFGADVWASDWLPMTAPGTLAQVLKRLDVSDGGIVLMHDTRTHTANMLPDLLRSLKQRGYRVVHIAPSGLPAFWSVR